MALFDAVNVQLLKRFVGYESVKLKFVTASVDSKFTGTELVLPICITVEPMLTCTHSPTNTANVTLLLSGGRPLSVAQMVMRLVVLPWSQAGAQEKVPLVGLMEAPAGAFCKLNVNSCEPFDAEATLVSTMGLPTMFVWSAIGGRIGGWLVETKVIAS